MLTAGDTELDEIKALELGADDYMSKPFSVAVLKARVKKMLKSTEHAILKSGAVSVDLSNGKVTKNGEQIELSSTELKLLVYFIKNQGLILSKEQILMQIWENDGEFVDDNIVSVNIRRLRIKIESDAKHPKHIKTVHGMGYIWKVEVITIMMSLFDDEQIMKTYWKDMENTLSDEIAHKKDRETAERLIKMGKLSLEEIAQCAPTLSYDELKELEDEVMQLA